MSKMSQIERTIQLENDIILPVFGQFDSNIRKIEKAAVCRSSTVAMM